MSLSDLLRRLLILFFITGGSAYLIAVFWMYLIQDDLVYVPGDRTLTMTPADFGLGFEEVSLLTEDSINLNAWFIPAPEPSGTVLFFHGNAGNISHLLETAEMFHTWGLQVLLFDYRGYGKSTGKPSEAGTASDATAAWNFLTGTKQIPANQIILHGRSLGAAIAADLATRIKPAGIILESGFTTLPDVGAEIYPWLPVRLVSRYRYPTIENITKVQSPVLIAHSRDDELIPFSHSEKLFKAAREPKSFFEMNGPHGTSFADSGKPYEDAIRNFIFNSLNSAAEE